jgi:hypothetical protein
MKKTQTRGNASKARGQEAAKQRADADAKLSPEERSAKHFANQRNYNVNH